MKKIILFVVLCITNIAYTQETTFEKEVRKISKRIEQITQEQKDSLKQKVIVIEERLEKGEISTETADTLKNEAANYHARQIEKLVGEQERLLQLLVQDKTNGKIASSDDNEYDDKDNVFTIGDRTFRFRISEDDDDRGEYESRERWKDRKKYQRSTTTQFVFAMGLNNVLVDNELSSFGNSDYRTWQSRFYELGFTWKTRFTKDPSQLYVKYGFSFLWNNLRLEGNNIHVKNGDMTEIQQFAETLDESRLRHVQMIFPLHIEWDLSKNNYTNPEKPRDRTNESFRIGVGGFAGFKLGTRQYLEYKDSDGIETELTQFDNFNMNVFNYGLSTYVGYESISLYAKYDLNSLFKNSNTNNFSLGIRLDLD